MSVPTKPSARAQSQDPQQPKNIIVGTAGHIDHGKSALIAALTGTHPDRLEEEKRRGITLDLGFAFLDLGETRIGFVDVPGHEHFVRNMLAGATGFDLVLLVIAADNSVQPQTREHFDICRLLNIPRGIVVLTKIDLVDADTLELVRLEVMDFLRGSFLEGAPIVPVSAKSGAGLDMLRLELARVAAEAPRKELARYFRLPIDRAFVMKGFGTVVTGTLVSGDVRPEDEVELFPARRRIRVRGVHSAGAPVPLATAGQRTAVNLAGVDLHDVSRGMVLASPGRFAATSQIDARIHLLPSAPRLKHRARVHFHQGTTETIAQVYMLDPAELAPGESALVQLRLAQPMLLLPGDRFILRRFSPVVTVGGGLVLDAAPARHRSRERGAALELLRVFERGVQPGPVQQHGTAPFTAASAGRIRENAPATTDTASQTRSHLASDIASDITRGDATHAAIHHESHPGNARENGGLTHPNSGANRRENAGQKQNAFPNADRDTRHDALAALVSASSAGMTLENLAARTGWLEAEIRAAVQALASGDRLRIISEQPFVVASIDAIDACASRIIAEVDGFHRASPLIAAISKENLRERTAAAVRPELFRSALSGLVLARKLEIAGDLVKRAGRAIDLQPAEVLAKAQIERQFARCGLSAPAVDEVLAKLAIDPRRAEKLLELLLREKILIRISRELVFHNEAVVGLRQRLQEFKRTRGATLPVGDFKALAGISRKYAIPLLEYFDRERVTRREGGARVIL